MMINFKYSFTFVMVMILSMTMLKAQQTAALPDGVIMAVKNSDAETLSHTFNEQIELVLPQKTAVYSRKQAEMVMKNFFEQNQVSEFKLIHQGKKDKASYAIANYYTSNGQFRFTFLTKERSGTIYIHQIRIERQ